MKKSRHRWPAEPKKIKIVIADWHGNEQSYDCDADITFSKIFEVHKDEMKITEPGGWLLYEGRRIDPDRTPRELGMPSHVVVDVMKD